MNKDKSNKTVLGIIGAIIGAGVAVVAGKYLSEKKNREKVVDIFSDVKEHFIDPLQEEEVKATKPKRKAVKKSSSAVKVKRKVAKSNGKKTEEEDISHASRPTLKN